MIVIMHSHASPESIQGVMDRITEAGFKGQVSQGEEREVIGVIGTGFPPDFDEKLARLPGVDHVARISNPYKLASRDFRPEDSVVRLDGATVGANEFVVMAGPCSVETIDQVMETARRVKESGASILRGGAFKPRTSPYSFQGLGKMGLEYLAMARSATGLPIITEVMEPGDVELVERYADILQVGARNMQNFPLLKEVGKGQKPVLLKRGMSATIEEWLMAAEYVLDGGNNQLMLCERGIRTFENMVRNTLDLSAVPVIKKISHLPIIVDPSHGTGKWYLVKAMALAAAAAGADGILVEVHPEPEKALSDGPQSLTPDNFDDLMRSLRPVVEAVGRELRAPEPARARAARL